MSKGTEVADLIEALVITKLTAHANRSPCFAQVEEAKADLAHAVDTMQEP